MRIIKVPNGVFAENSYVVIDEQTRLCIVVDPGEEPGLILQKIEAADAQPMAICLTHAQESTLADRWPERTRLRPHPPRQ